MSQRASLALFVAATLFGASAHGNPPPPSAASDASSDSSAGRAAAKRYVDAANQAYQSGQYELAVRAYEEAHRVLPLPAITFSTAQAYRLRYYQDRNAEHLHRALELYRRYLDEAPAGNRRGHATQHIETIETILRTAAEPLAGDSTESRGSRPPPTTELMVVSRTPKARARIDGGGLLEVPFAREVSPGKRAVEVLAPGYASARSEWLAREGRLVVASIELAPLPATIHVTAPRDSTVRVDGRLSQGADVSVPAGSHVVSVTERGHEPATRRVSVGPGERASVQVRELEPTGRRVTALWLLGGAGGLALAGGVTTTLALSAEQRVQEYDDGIGRRTYEDRERLERNDDLAARDRFRTLSWVLFGAAAAAGATGGLLWWFDEPAAEGPATGGVTPLIAPETAGMAWVTAF